MKNIKLILILVATLAASSQSQREHVDSLTTIDSELRKYFPRWKICEPDLQFQIRQAFKVLGFSNDELNEQDIQVLAAPKSQNSEDPSFDILLLTCGVASMNSIQIERELNYLQDVLAGVSSFNSDFNSYKQGKRDYCYEDIPSEAPVKPSQNDVIRHFFRPRNENQAIVVSLFNQNLKIGDTGFWLLSSIGNDRIGMPFWTAGEANVVLQRPLYLNTDPDTKKETPYLINAYLGGTYRLNSGVNPQGVLELIPERKLNSHPSGKIAFGLDFHLPSQPEFGAFFNVNAPLSEITDESFDEEDFALYEENESASSYVDNNDVLGFDPLIEQTEEQREAESTGNLRIMPVLETTGQMGVFYNLWLNKRKAEHFFRIELGINYYEIREYLAYGYDIANIDGEEVVQSWNMTNTGVTGVGLIHPQEFQDWLYTKVEYRNQAVFPFSVSVQYANNTMMTRAYLPLFANWLFLEAKYATPLGDTPPWQLDNFFMISPVLRITI